MGSCKVSGLVKKAAQQALDGQWDEAHKTVQLYEDDPTACWIHAVLHKVEGDIENSKYWYRLANKQYSEMDPQEELKAIINDQA